jgi:hypothetical protein
MGGTTPNISDYKVTLKVETNQNVSSANEMISNAQLNLTPLRPTTLSTTTPAVANITSASSSAAIKEAISTNAAINISRAINNAANNVLNNSVLNHNDSTIACINAHAATLPIEQIKEIIKDSIDEMKDEFMSENFKFKSEILKEFMIIKVRFFLFLQRK